MKTFLTITLLVICNPWTISFKSPFRQSDSMFNIREYAFIIQSNRDSSMRTLEENSNYYPIDRNSSRYYGLPKYEADERISSSRLPYQSSFSYKQSGRLQIIRNLWRTISSFYNKDDYKSQKVSKKSPLVNVGDMDYSEKSGIFNAIKRTFRRRLLNILDKYPKGWANSVSKDMNDAQVYASMPSYRNIITQSDSSVNGDEIKGRFSLIRKAVKGIRKTINRQIFRNSDRESSVSNSDLIPLSDSEMRVFSSRRVVTSKTIDRSSFPSVIVKYSQQAPLSFDLDINPRNSTDLAGLAANISFGSTVPQLIWSSITTLGNIFTRNQSVSIKNKLTESESLALLASQLSGSLQRGLDGLVKISDENNIRSNYDVNYKAFMNRNHSSMSDVAVGFLESAWSIVSSTAVGVTVNVIDTSIMLRNKLTNHSDIAIEDIEEKPSVNKIIPTEVVTMNQFNEFDRSPRQSESAVSAVMTSEKIEVDNNDNSIKSGVLYASSLVISLAFPITKGVFTYFGKYTSKTKPKDIPVIDINTDYYEDKRIVVEDNNLNSIYPSNEIISLSNEIEYNSSPGNFLFNLLSPVGQRIRSLVIPNQVTTEVEDNSNNMEIEIETSSLDSDLILSYNPANSVNFKKIPFPLITEDKPPNNINKVSKVTKVRPPLESDYDAAQSKQSDKPTINEISVDENFNVKMGKSQEFKSRPQFLDREKVPIPTRADFSFINARRINVAVSAALAVRTEFDAIEFLREIGLKPLVSAILNPLPDNPDIRVDAIKGVCRLMRQDKSIAVSVSSVSSVITVLCVLIEAPLRGFLNFRSQENKDRELRAQRESIALVQRMIRSSSGAVDILRMDVRLRKVLLAVIAQGELNDASNVPESDYSKNMSMLTNKTALKKKKGSATIVDLVGLRPYEMARVAAWGLGGVPWKPKVPGQKGLRILSFDGGGTRGVFSIAMLKELMLRVGKSAPFESFDIICGTSTGGIIAMLLGVKRTRVDEAEKLYDNLIDKVFGQKSNLKLVTEQAFYDENEFERVLYDICGDELLIDSNRKDCARVFCVSTRVNNNPPLIHLWRNYNYPPGLESRYSGEFRINTYSSVRATTAAPTFFTPVQHEGGLYCDGALVANNPTAIALQEAKVLYPNIPIELVVSIGTGYFNQNSNVQSMGWDLLVNQLIASSTDTEDVHALLVDFLPPDKYFRLNAQLQDLLAIDEKNKTVLLDLKRLAKQTWRDIDLGKDAKRFEQLIKTLKGNTK